MKGQLSFYIYILYSHASSKTYTGLTNDVDRRLAEHNITATKGFTLRYRPWTLIHREAFMTKHEAASREKYLKTGRGREEVKVIVQKFLCSNGAVSTAEN